MIRVRKTGFPLRPALTTSAKSILTMMGYIMKKRQMAIGIDTTGAPFTDIAIPSRERATPGAILPRSIPATMQRPTHTVRYLSKTLFILLVSLFDAILPISSRYLIASIVAERAYSSTPVPGNQSLINSPLASLTHISTFENPASISISS